MTSAELLEELTAASGDKTLPRKVRYYLVTNIDFDDWTDYLGDPPLAMALIDRMVDDAIIERFDGKSYRAYRAEQKAKQNGRKPSTKTSNSPDQAS